MKYNIKECPQLDEKVYEYKHSSGLDVFFIPKKGYFEKYAMFSVKYGSIDCTFNDKNGNRVEAPAGIAHFLEHKLFEQKDGNVMDKFAVLGSSQMHLQVLPKLLIYFHVRIYLKIILTYCWTSFKTRISQRKA